LNTVDTFSRKDLPSKGDTLLSGVRLGQVLERLAASRGLPEERLVTMGSNSSARRWTCGFETLLLSSFGGEQARAT
jgi:hypothetical protein